MPQAPPIVLEWSTMCPWRAHMDPKWVPCGSLMALPGRSGFLLGRNGPYLEIIGPNGSLMFTNHTGN